MNQRVSKIYTYRIEGKDYAFDGNSYEIVHFNSKKVKKSEIKTYFKNTKPELELVHKKHLRSITLSLTHNCNLACKYCYASQGGYDSPGSNMSWDTAKKSLDLLINSAKENNLKTISVTFFGGEPLIKWDAIVKSVEYVNRHKPLSTKAYYAIVTNGTLLTKEKIHFLKKNNFNLAISLDGLKSQNDKNRVYLNGKGTFKDVEEKIKLAVSIFPKTTVRATINPDNLDLISLVNHFKDLGIKNITLGINHEAFNQKTYPKLFKALSKLQDKYYRDIKGGENYYLTHATVNILQVIFKIKRYQHCNAGINYLATSTNGELYKCHRFIDNNKYTFGKNSQEYNQLKKKIRKNQKRLALLKCNDCVFSNLCGGLCTYNLNMLGHGEGSVESNLCKYKKESIISAIKLYTKLGPERTRNLILAMQGNIQQGGEQFE